MINKSSHILHKLPKNKNNDIYFLTLEKNDENEIIKNQNLNFK